MNANFPFPGLAATMGGDDPPPTPVAIDVDVVRLRTAFEAYHRREAPTLAPGDLVRYKSGLGPTAARYAPPTGVYVVMEVVPDRAPCADVDDPGKLGLVYDLYLGYYDGAGDFVFCWSDSRRYERVPGSEP